MGFTPENKLVIAVSSRALFDNNEANKIFEEQGEAAYQKHQWENRETILQPGVAFPFIKRLLQFNKPGSPDNPVEVIVLSRNSAISGLRFFKSCEHYNLDITRGTFTAGRSPYEYMDAFNCSLFLSANKSDVDAAIKDNKPAGLIMPNSAPLDPQTNELRVAFDFDGVLVDDSSEKIYQEHGIEGFREHEKEKAAIPAKPGPLKKLITGLARIQAIEQKMAKENASYVPKLRISIVTARNAPAHERVITTLKKWNINAAEAFFLGGVEKKRILGILKPHIFFDDQLRHLEPACAVTPSVHIPFGITNQ